MEELLRLIEQRRRLIFDEHGRKRRDAKSADFGGILETALALPLWRYRRVEEAISTLSPTSPGHLDQARLAPSQQPGREVVDFALVLGHAAGEALADQGVDNALGLDDQVGSKDAALELLVGA
jgi:hypothetical protein